MNSPDTSRMSKFPSVLQHAQEENGIIASSSQSWEGREVGCLSMLWDGLCKIVQQIFDQCCAWLCCCGSETPGKDAESLQGKVKMINIDRAISSEKAVKTNQPKENHPNNTTENFQVPTYTSKMQTPIIIAEISEKILETSCDASQNLKTDHADDSSISKTISQSQNSTDSESDLEGILTNKVDEIQSYDLSSLGDVEIMNLFQTQEAELRKSLGSLSNKDAVGVMNKCINLPLDMLSASQGDYYFSHLKADKMSEETYQKLYCNYNKTDAERFHHLPDDEAAVFMLQFDLRPDKFLSPSQKTYFYSNLKSDQIDEKLFEKLYTSFDYQTNKERFQKVANEEAFALMIKFDCDFLWILSDQQKIYFYSNLKANQVDKKNCEKLYRSSDYQTNKERFQKLANEEAFALMIKFDCDLLWILSVKQKNYFFSHLKAEQVDQKLYDELYSFSDYYTNKEIKERFQKLPNEEAAAFLLKFNLAPIWMLSDTQKNYFFSHLKSDQVDKKLYDELYPLSDHYTNKESKERFQKLANEEAFALMIKFECDLLWVLSDQQKNYFFSHLKADQVDKKLYEELYPFSDHYTNKESKERFQKLPNEEAAAFMLKFNLAPEWMLSDLQKDYWHELKM